MYTTTAVLQSTTWLNGLLVCSVFIVSAIRYHNNNHRSDIADDWCDCNNKNRRSNLPSAVKY